MKYIIVLGDGMADEPIEKLNGKTPLEYANTPIMDMLAPKSEIGLMKTVPDGMKPGSDTANLAVLGYNPKKYYSGRSPLEALSIGIDMENTDIAIRCNIVTLSDDGLPYEQKKIIDHSSGEITTEEAAELIDAVKKDLENESYKFYVGTSYRHLTIWKNGRVTEFTQPHDILGKTIDKYLPSEPDFSYMMKRSFKILNEHPINIKRQEKGLNKANSLWFWGAGTKPKLDSFEKVNNKKGVMISAVDLLKGIAVGSKMKVINVDGADATLNTNYEGKAKACVDALLKDNFDFAYVHIEAPDEMGHQGNIENKIKSIEYLDKRVIKIIYEELKKSGEDFRLLITPDHPTPIYCRTHTSSPVPYLLYDNTNEQKNTWLYNEKEAQKSGNFIEKGYTFINKLFNN